MSGLNDINSDRSAFYAEVYHIVQQIPAGRVLTYGLIARLTGKPQHARWVGRALADAPSSLALPCHRVVNSQGATAPQWPAQQQLLRQEGIRFKANGCVDLQQFLWKLF